MELIFHRQISAFKINLIFGFILRDINTNEFLYLFFSENVLGRYVDVPNLIRSVVEFQAFVYNLPHQHILT